ncbi:SIR2 family protein [Psychroserpens burtonensis]|uniref:SIR2 family protein n=1 Tax=Psychroserpens burtonensis TaxID=49278 RepID=UPI000423C748|nr:SIR2 family protein [Psychroserpens burtonensis]
MENKTKKETARKTYINKVAYLFGNGINRSKLNKKDRYEWGNLLEDLNKQFANTQISNIRNKPFPMVYDEIVNYSLRNGNRSEGYLKSFIKSKIDQIQPNYRYNNLKKIKNREILTTNYDYLIENSLEDNWKRKPINKLEYYYSIYRYQQTSRTKVWHIHGEQADSRSLLLGFRHYINYASKVKARAELFINGLKNNTEHLNPSWVDLFFTHNINIVGLGMSYTEYPLWWLLAYRNQKIVSDPNLDINNRITFFTPSFEEKDNIDLIDILKAYSVKCNVIKVSENDYDGFYEKVLKFN